VINNNCTCVYIKENKDKELKHAFGQQKKKWKNTFNEYKEWWRENYIDKYIRERTLGIEQWVLHILSSPFCHY
jgi:Ni/Co efflux regulator RcnB